MNLELNGFAELLAAAILLATVANRLTEGLITPFFDKFGWDKFYLMYAAWGLGAVIVFLGGINLFTAYIPDPLVGQIITALLAGGGSNLLHDLFKQNSIEIIEEIAE